MIHQTASFRAGYASEPAKGAASLTDIEVALPPDLRRFGQSVRATSFGPEDAPAVVVLGGISANRFPSLTAANIPGWWSGLAGPSRAVDPAIQRVIGIDFAADEAGRLAPSTRDQAEIVCAALDAFGIAEARAIVGASYGGMIALSIGQHFPDRASRLVVVSAPSEPHPMATALRDLQRRIVAFGLENEAATEGLALARGLAMLTYRCPQEFEERFIGGIEGDAALGSSAPGDYLRARGKAYQAVMSPGRFVSLSASIDRHRVQPTEIRLPAVIIGSTTDQLVPPAQLRSLAASYGGDATLHLLPSRYGHDMFLKQASEVSDLVAPFLRSVS